MHHDRYHAFDSLRGAMMLLGVVLHSATMYATIDGIWWMKDPETGRWADALILFVHAFRLPVFFVMAGFFARLLKEKRGWQAMLENRMARLGVPFLLALITIFPILRAFSLYSHFAARGPEPFAATLNWFASGRFGQTLEPGHMWFLETLLWTLLLALPLMRYLDRLDHPALRRVLTARWGWAALAPLTFLTLLTTEAGVLDTPKGFTPNWHIVAAYFVFFAFGWGLYRNREALPALRRGGWPEILAAIALLAPTLVAITAEFEQRDTRLWAPFLTVAACTALTCWLMIYGLIGLFLRRFSEPSPLSRYLSDSAYWVYLVHPVALVTIQLPMTALPAPAFVKFLLGIAFAVPAVYWTYDRWARPTWVGVLLNGRRHPRGLPGLQPQPAPQTCAEPAGD
jgi:glucans biosynthesis protein C